MWGRRGGKTGSLGGETIETAVAGWPEFVVAAWGEMGAEKRGHGAEEGRRPERKSGQETGEKPVKKSVALGARIGDRTGRKPGR